MASAGRTTNGRREEVLYLVIVSVHPSQRPRRLRELLRNALPTDTGPSPLFELLRQLLHPRTSVPVFFGLVLIVRADLSANSSRCYARLLKQHVVSVLSATNRELIIPESACERGAEKSRGRGRVALN